MKCNVQTEIPPILSKLQEIREQFMMLSDYCTEIF